MDASLRIFAFAICISRFSMSFLSRLISFLLRFSSESSFFSFGLALLSPSVFSSASSVSLLPSRSEQIVLVWPIVSCLFFQESTQESVHDFRFSSEYNWALSSSALAFSASWLTLARSSHRIYQSWSAVSNSGWLKSSGFDGGGVGGRTCGGCEEIDVGGKGGQPASNLTSRGAGLDLNFFKFRETVDWLIALWKVDSNHSASSLCNYDNNKMSIYSSYDLNLNLNDQPAWVEDFLMREGITRIFRLLLLLHAFVSSTMLHARGRLCPYPCFDAKNGQNKPIEMTDKASSGDFFWWDLIYWVEKIVGLC